MDDPIRWRRRINPSTLKKLGLPLRANAEVTIVRRVDDDPYISVIAARQHAKEVWTRCPGKPDEIIVHANFGSPVSLSLISRSKSAKVTVFVPKSMEVPEDFIRFNR